MSDPAEASQDLPNSALVEFPGPGIFGTVARRISLGKRLAWRSDLPTAPPRHGATSPPIPVIASLVQSPLQIHGPASIIHRPLLHGRRLVEPRLRRTARRSRIGAAPSRERSFRLCIPIGCTPAWLPASASSTSGLASAPKDREENLIEVPKVTSGYFIELSASTPCFR